MGKRDFSNVNSHFILDTDNNMEDEIFVEEFHSSGLKKYKCYEYNESTGDMVSKSMNDLEIDISGYRSQSVFEIVPGNFNGLGEIIVSEDDDGHTVNTYYYSNGLPKEMVMNNSSHKVEMEYDFYGNKTRLIDPNAATIW